MQQEIKLNGKTLLFVGLPKEAKNINVIGFMLHFDINDYVDSHSFKKIPSKGFELVGIHPNLTEEQAKTIMPGISTAQLDGVWYSVGEGEKYCYPTAKEAFNSLMQREKLYTVNPYGQHPDKWKYLSEAMHLKEYDVKQWQEAEQRTFPQWAVLVKND